MHGKRCYVKLAFAGLFLTLAFAAPAHAERVGPAVEDALLALAPDGTPFVAFVHDNQVSVESRGATGWSGQSVYSGPARLAGFAVGPSGAYDVLVEDPNGHWLTLVTSSAVTPIVRPGRKAGLLGPAGLTLDAKGAPVVAYTAMRGRVQPRLGGIPTYLRLARGQGRELRTSPITRRGFPQSYVPPAAAPVLVKGRIHVVETYKSAAIEWMPKRNGDWIGQYLFLSLFGSPVGPIAAVATPTGSVWSAWTQEYPEFGETHVIVSLRADDETTDDALQHGALVSLTLGDGQPELAANDWVDVGTFRDYAGLIKDVAGDTIELDGRLLGYLATADGHREVLLADANGLEWYDVLARPSVHVSLTAMADGRLTGRVDVIGGGSVELYREQRGQRTLVANVPLAADGSFTIKDTAPSSPTLYRAVYRDLATGLPYASLARTPVGSG